MTLGDVLNKIDLAIKWEAKRFIRRAFSIYKELINEEEKPDLEIILNMLVLCFEVQDPASYALYDIDLQFEEECWKYLKRILPKAKSLYPNSVELAFWENYIFFRYWGNPPFQQIDKKFCNQTESLVPYFFFYDPETGRYIEEARKLWKIVESGRTCRERYIKEMLGKNSP